MNPSPRVVYLTAGAGGMFCGSCLNDNTLVRALTRQGVDAQLVPTYTPIRTDEQDVSIDRVFYGGINVFLQQKWPWLRYLPAAFDRLLNHPGLIRLATRKDVQADPRMLGDLQVSMLKGLQGFQQKETRRLLQFLGDTQPDLIHLTNVLIAGCVPAIKQQMGVPIVVTLQGDDIFLDYIPAAQRQQATRLIQDLVPQIDAFVVHSEFYAEAMGSRLAIPREKLHVLPLGIDVEEQATAGRGTPPADTPSNSSHGDRPLRIGYLARLTPEKGFDLLVDAFLQLGAARADVRLEVAGWVGSEHGEFAESQFQRLRDAGLGDRFTYHGVVDRQQKLDFLRQLDVFCVPTRYLEPKGRYVLEAMAAGVPVVLPRHGAFPEMLTAPQNNESVGVLVNPLDADDLVRAWNTLLDDSTARRRLGEAGRQQLHATRTADVMATRTLALYKQLLDSAQHT